jgi:hypothetical protein
MKLDRPVKKKKKLAVVRLFDDEEEQTERPESKPQAKSPAVPLLADGRYVEVHKGGKGIKERWKTLGPFSIEKQCKMWKKLSKKGKRVRKMTKRGNTRHIGSDTYYMEIAHKAQEAKADSFFNPSKFKKTSKVKLHVRKRFKHTPQMKVKRLHDEEHYIVDISTPNGTTIGIVPGYRLKNKDFWKSKLAVYPMAPERHWTRRANPPEAGKFPKKVEVLFPWRMRPTLAEKNRNEKGRRLVAFVTPVSATDLEKREKIDPAYEKLVNKFTTL